jgi:hypothetical protein
MGMSANFEKMASEAKLAHELGMALKSQQQADRKQARLRLLDDAVAALTSDVIPLLEQAIVAFSRHGISAKMTRDFAIKECMEKNPSQHASVPMEPLSRCAWPRRKTAERRKNLDQRHVVRARTWSRTASRGP